MARPLTQLARLLVVVLLLLSWAAVSGNAELPTATIVDDNDWRDPALVARCEGVEREMTPALLLKTEFKQPVFLFDPTDDETITTITDFQGKLYLGSCTEPAGTDTGSVFTYAPESHQWQKVFQVNEQGLTRLEVYGDHLYIPGYDANDGGWDLGNIYVHDGTTWVEHRTVPRAIHEYGLAVWRGRIYVSADILDPAPPGMTVDEAGEKGLIDGYGRVVSSGDGGLTWREEYRGPHPGQDVGLMAVFNDKLILNAQGDLFSFDGKRWERLGLNPNALIVFDYADAGDVLVLGTSLGLGFYDGSRFWLASYKTFQGHVRAVCRFGSSWVMLVNWITGGFIRHGPGGTGYMRLGPGARPVATGLWVFPESVLPRIVAGQETMRTVGAGMKLVNTDEMAVSAHALKGRLFLGTHPEGRVLVLPVVSAGTLESAPRPVLTPGEYILSWESATPPGTSCRLQVRTAPTLEALEQAPYVGPGGSPDALFEIPGASIGTTEPGFLQYRVTLGTENPALTPYLKRVTIASGG